MITGASVRLGRFATWRVLAITGVAFAVLAGALFATSLPFSIAEVTRLCGQPPPDVRSYTSGDGVSQFLTQCGASGRAAYEKLQVADLFYPAVSGVFLAVALAMTLNRVLRPGSPVMALAALPLAGSFFDYLENAAAWMALSAAPGPTGTAARLLGLASIAKQTVTASAWLLLCLALGCAVFRAVRRVRLQPQAEHDVVVQPLTAGQVPPHGAAPGPA